MANNIHELAKEALDNGNYQLAVELFKRILQLNAKMNTSTETMVSIETYVGYADSLARCGHIRESFDVFAFVCNQLGYAVPLDKLEHLTLGLLESVTSSTVLKSRQRQLSNTDHPIKQNNFSNFLTNASNSVDANQEPNFVKKFDNFEPNSCISNCSKSGSSSNCSVDGDCTVLLDNKCNKTNINDMCDLLVCSICDEILMWPVTMACGHTFCRDCIYNQTQCQVCGKPILLYGENFKQDVLISRLIEKWWTPILQAQMINDETQTFLRQNALDKALISCNASLEKNFTNYKGLLLRSEVLYRLNHFKSSLADADNAIKCRPNSHKAYLNRAMSLTALGLIDDAIVSHCLSAYFNRTLSSFSSTNRLEIAKLIQKKLMPAKSNRTSVEPYYAKEYLNRYNLRALRHFSNLHFDKRLQPSSFGCDSTYFNDCNDDMNEENLLKTNLNCHSLNYNKCHTNANNSFMPYKKPQKFFRNLKRIRRKQCENGPNEKLQEIFDLDRLAKVMTNSVTDTVIASNVVDARITDLIDRIQLECSNLKKIQGRTLLEVNPSLIDLSDFDCVLCYRTLWKPVATPCGHTYCMVCLDRCLDYSACCPLCKTSLVDDLPTSYSINQLQNYSSSSGTNCNLVSFSASKKSVTRFIEIAMQRFIPLAYKKRQHLEIEKEPSVPVFICTTAYPNVPCPLYVYEPRHRLMIRRAIESGHRQFGIVQPHANGGYSDFGTILDIRDCVLLGNGCSILSTIGCKRFKAIERNERDGYDTAKVEYIYDEAISQDRLDMVKRLNETIYRKATDWYNSLPAHIHNEIHKSFGSLPALEKELDSITDGPSWAWYIIALLPLNQNLKVEILATTDLEKRLRAIDKTLEYVAAQQRRSVCVLSCEGLQTCQAVDCCLRATSSNHLDDDAHPHTTQGQVTEFLL